MLSSSVFAADKDIYTRLFLNNDQIITVDAVYTAGHTFSTEQINDFNEKNRTKAFLMSLLVPGWGQSYAESKTRSLIYMGTEIGLWLAYGGLVAYSDWREQDYRNYAAAHAGVNNEGKSSSFFIDVGNYNSIYEYNDAKLRQRNLNEYYRDTETFYWQWQSKAHRERFDQLRISSDTAYNRSTMLLGVIMANHLISAIDALITVNKYNDQLASKTNVRFKLSNTTTNQAQVMVSLTRQF